MHAELREDGFDVGRHGVARLMRDNGLKALQKRRYKKTTDSKHGGPVATNLLDQDFSCNGPDQKWGADISYIWTSEGWLYCCAPRDLALIFVTFGTRGVKKRPFNARLAPNRASRTLAQSLPLRTRTSTTSFEAGSTSHS